MQARAIVHTLSERVCPWMPQARRQALEVMVNAALCGGRLTVTELGRSIDSSAKEKHCIKRADRLLSKAHLV
jgi:hypothetical protein